MAKRPHRYTRMLGFDQKTRKRIRERDQDTCIFCSMGYHMEYISGRIPGKDIMHFIPRSQMGLGIEQNGALGCREHHDLLDNGSRGLRPEMLARFEGYLRGCYQDWDRDRLVYRKYDF